MCVAIVKPIGINLPDRKRLKICFDNNPHGIGFGIGTPSNINAYKAVYKFNDFDDFYYKLVSLTFEKSDIVFIHFRYATHGGINLNNCHPFYISDNQESIIQDKPILMHNGVFQLGKLKPNKSDTFTLVEKMYKENIELDNDLITKSNNKVAIMYDKCKYRLYGNWIQADDGCIYSNGSYRKSLEEYKKKYNNENLNFCDCCGEIGENYLTTEVGYHFCNNCIENKKVFLYHCERCGNICADKICSDCSEKENISLKYWK